MSNLPAGQTIGPYQIVNQIGKGGMATVYKAYHPATDRYVAVKVLPHEFMHNEKFLGRFHQEVRLIAKLEHAYILPVYDYGESDGTPYLVMRYLDAGTLKERIQTSSLSLFEVDRYFTQLAQALDYAHEQGIVHRDIKPSNVLVDRRGNLFLTDFGIAKLVESESSLHLTATGAVTGTPAYMSPEQAMGKKVDQRTDIYSLGVVLYEMLTGRVPFEADTPMAVVIKHIEAPLPPPSFYKPDIHPAIEAVLLKALAKDPAVRFGTMREFLKNWQRAYALAMPSLRVVTPTPKPVEAMVTAQPARRGVEQGQPLPAAPAKSFVKPVIIIAGILLVLFLVCLVLGGGTFWGLYKSGQGVTSVAFSPVGSLLASASTDTNDVDLWDPRGGSLVRILKGHTSRVSSLAFSPDGFTLASASWDKTVIVWDVRSANKLATLQGHTDSLTSVAFSPDRNKLATASWDKSVILWDIKSGAALHKLEGHTDWVNCVAFSHDGSILASGSDDDTVILWDVQSGKQLSVLKGHTSSVKSLAFSPNDSILVSGSLDKTIIVWGLPDGLRLRTLRKHTGTVNSLAFSPDGKMLASGSDDKTVLLWDINSGESLRVFTDARDRVTSITFSPDGKTLAAGVKDFTILVWDVGSGALLKTIK